MRTRVVVLFASLLIAATSCTSTLASNTSSPSPTPTPTPSPSPSPSPTVAASPASIGGIPLAEGEVGIGYSNSLTASGGPGPYAWSLDSGSLPPGINFGADGSVSGTPTTAGTFSFTVKATDSQAQYTTKTASITIAAHVSGALLPQCATACYVEQGCVNVCGAFGTQAGGVGPFHYVATGHVPGGMSVAGFSLAGSFPQTAQFWQFTDTVTDSLGATASLSPVFYVYKHIAISPTSLRCSSQSPPTCAVQLTYSGGTPNATPSARTTLSNATICTISITGQPISTPTTSYPPFWSVKVSGGVISVSAGPTPAGSCGYTGTVTIWLIDKSSCGSPTYCTSNQATILVSF